MTEDGGELDNRFIRNIGASTRAAKHLVRSFETDKSNPSTFWCSNPSNTWIGNVAAGSESSGFWFELQREVRPPTLFLETSASMAPRHLSLTTFRDNVAHSNWRHGLRTYPEGFAPVKGKAIFEHTLSYKNGQAGIFFHNSQDMQVRGGLVADNAIQIDLDRADNIGIGGTKIVGESKRFRSIVESQEGLVGSFESLVGIQLHSFTTDETRSGATIRNIRFSGFAGSHYANVALIQVDDKVESGHFDYW